MRVSKRSSRAKAGKAGRSKEWEACKFVVAMASVIKSQDLRKLKEEKFYFGF